MDKVDFKGKRILVTGGNGYLGKNLVKALKKKNAIVFIVDKEGADIENMFKVDITNGPEVEEAIQKIQPQIIFHLAASLNRERNFDRFEEINRVNHLGTYYLLKALQNISYDNFIFTSTSEVYGDNIPPFSENQILNPSSPYSLTKLYAENLIKTFSNTYNKKFTILRLFNFFGKNMPVEFFIPQMINALKNKASFEMTEGDQKRDFLYIDDVLQAMILSAGSQGGQNEIFNVCSGNAITLKQIVKDIKASLNSNCKINFGALPYRNNEVWNMQGDNKKITKKLGFKVNYNFKNAIEEILKNN
jgi:UDP-glucose 4-epimerase